LITLIKFVLVRVQIVLVRTRINVNTALFTYYGDYAVSAWWYSSL